MKDKAYRRLLYVVMAVGIIGTVAHAIYAIYLYQHCSIISFIANGG